MSGRPYTANREHNDEMRQGVYCTAQEQVDLLGYSAAAGDNITIATDYIILNGNLEITLWSYATGAALSAGSNDLTITYYRRLSGTGSSTTDTFYQVGGSTTVSTPAAADGSCGSVSITGVADTATHYKVSGTVTVDTGCYASIQVGKMNTAVDEAVAEAIEGSYSSSSNALRVEEIDPLNLHYVNEHVVDESNEAAATYRTIIPFETYKSGSIQWNISGGVTMTIWATNDDTADATADTGWEDITTEVTGNASEADNTGIAFLDTNISVSRLMIKRVTSDSSNASDVFVFKGY